MPRQIALLFSVILIIYLFWMDRKNNEGVSNAVWIPFIWMFLAGSRYVSQWLDLRGLNYSTEAMLEGSPVDRAVFLLLIIAGLFILQKRRIDWNSWFADNKWIWLFFLFGALSFLWADYPFVALKRWVKALGNVVMVLVVLTEERPYAAIGLVLRRLAFILLPLSVLFIKYYPELGRAYHMGRPMFTGVGFQKNQLGQICMISATYFSWNLILNRGEENGSGKSLHYSVYLIILPMIAWLLQVANSATSLACTIAAICIFAVGRLPTMVNRPKRILPFGIACLAFIGILEIAFDVKNTVIYMLGRTPDLTSRTEIWENLLPMVKNPLTGLGFESFWLGGRGQYARELVGVGQAHNGYLEMYLHLGLFGLFFVLAWIVSGLKKVHRFLEIDYRVAILRLCFIIVVSLYNWTEATFAGVNNMWMLLFFGIMDTYRMKELGENGRQKTQ